ncbi:MAG: MFS transporter [Candidatus Korarchaeota archaeon]|nr:MFS transporter [Candidatus Korarchaeota archaeon]
MRTRFKWITVLSLAFLGFARSTGWALNKGLSFPLLSSYTESAFIKGSVLALEGLIGMIIPPILGYYSDIMRSKHGRRKPFVAVGGILASLASISIYLAYFSGLGLLGFSLTLAFLYLSLHVYTAQYRALMPDTVESGQRGRASGIITLFEWAGNLFLFGLAGMLMAVAVESTGGSGIKALASTPYLQVPFLVTAAFLLVSALVVYFLVKEPEIHVDREEGLWEYVKSVVSNRDFLRFYTAQIMWWLSFEFVAIFLFGILAYILRGAATELDVKAVTSLGLLLMALFNVTVLVGSIPGGIIYDRIGRRVSIVAGSVVFALPQLWAWTISTKMEVIAALAVAGVGWGMLMASSFPVIGDLLTSYEREELTGRYYGFFEATRSLPILLAGVIGGAIVDLAGGNYRVLFPIGAILVLASIPLIWSMRRLER